MTEDSRDWVRLKAQMSVIRGQRPENKGQGKSFFYAANIMHHFMGFR